MRSLYLFLLIILPCASCEGQNATQLYERGSRATKLIKTQGTGKHGNIQCALQDKEGNLWFGTAGEGVYRYDGKYFTQFTVKDGLNSNWVWSALEDNAGNIWLGTNDGLNRYNGKTITTVPIAGASSLYLNFDVASNSGSLEKNEVWSMMKDKSGQLWFGTRRGLFCYDGTTFTRFLDKPGVVNKDSLSLVMVECMLEAKDSTIWLGSGMIPGSEGICRYDPATGVLSSFKPEGNGWIRYMVEDHSGYIWIGTRHKGIWRYDGKVFSKSMAGGDIGLSALVDKAGNVWFSGGEKDDGYSSDGGMWMYDGKNLKRFSDNSLGGYGVWTMLQDKAGNIWFGTRNMGLYRYDGKSFTSFSE